MLQDGPAVAALGAAEDLPSGARWPAMVARSSGWLPEETTSPGDWRWKQGKAHPGAVGGVSSPRIRRGDWDAAGGWLSKVRR